MAQKFRIAKANKIDNYYVISDKVTVTEQIFWDVLKNKVKELTAEQPDKYYKTFERAVRELKSGSSSLTVLDTWFEIKGKN